MVITKRIISLLLITVMLVSAFSFMSSAAQTGTYRITTASLRVRSGPSENYAKIGNVYQGQTVNVTQVSGKWGKIAYNSTTGWICLDYAAYVTPAASGVATKQFTISASGLQMIKDFEGYYKYKYWDGGHYSIGYGSTCGANDYPNGISEAEASALLASNMASYEAGLDAFLYSHGIRVTQAQYDALVSFTYNFGNPWTRWDEFTLKTILIKGASKYSAAQIKAAFGEFVKANGVVVQGLVSRRNREAELFISGTTLYQYGSFNDVHTKNWYYEAVEFVNKKGYMTGVTGGKFEPNTYLTRAMMVTTLCKLGEVNIVPYKNKTSFSDVKASKWYAPYVEWAYKVGISNGTGNGKFSPDKLITRQDMVVMLYNFADIVGYNVSFADKGVLKTFKDHTKVSGYAVKAMNWAVNRGCISGNTANCILPLNNATRAETAQFVKNFHEKKSTWW